MAISTAKVTYQTAISVTDFKTLIESYGSSKVTITLTKPMTVAEDTTVPSNIKIRVNANGKLTISSGVTITFNGKVESHTDEWLDVSPDNPPIFSKRSYVRVDEFVGDDKIKIQCALNSGSYSNHCDVRLTTGSKYSIPTGSIYLQNDATNNPGFNSTQTGQGRLRLIGGAKLHSWPELEDDSLDDTIIEFGQTTGNCFISDLSSHATINRYSNRSFIMSGICIIANTSDNVIYLDAVCESSILEMLTIYNQNFSGNGILWTNGWSFKMRDINLYGDHNRLDTASYNTGYGIRMYMDNPSYVSGGQITLDHVTTDGWHYGKIIGGDRLSDLTNPTITGFQTTIHMHNCISQICEIGVYIGSGTKGIELDQMYTENCRDINVHVDNGATNVAFNNCYFNMRDSITTAGLRLGEYNALYSSFFNGVYAITLTNCLFRNIGDSAPAILRYPGETARAASFTEAGCSFVNSSSATASVAHNFFYPGDAYGYQGPTIITGEEYTGSGIWYTDYNKGFRYVTMYVDPNFVRFGRPVVHSGSTVSMVANDLNHENKGNYITINSDGDLNNILPIEEGMDMYLVAGDLDGFTMIHSNTGDSTKNIRTAKHIDTFVPYTKMVHLKAVNLGSSVIKWVQEGLDLYPDPIQYITDPASGICAWDGETKTIGLDSTIDINEITGFYGGAEVFLFCRTAAGITIKHNSAGSYKILCKSGADTDLDYHKVMHLVAIDDGSFEYWMEL